jgi:hypothetical protein
MQVKGWTCRDTSPADYSASGWDASGPARFLRGRMLCLAKGWKSVKKCCDDGRGAGPALTNTKKKFFVPSDRRESSGCYCSTR